MSRAKGGWSDDQERANGSPWCTVRAPRTRGGGFAVHVMTERDFHLKLHLVDINGRCDCNPEDSAAEDRHSGYVWVHKERSELNG